MSVIKNRLKKASVGGFDFIYIDPVGDVLSSVRGVSADVKKRRFSWKKMKEIFWNAFASCFAFYACRVNYSGS